LLYYILALCIYFFHFCKLFSRICEIRLSFCLRYLCK